MKSHIKKKKKQVKQKLWEEARRKMVLNLRVATPLDLNDPFIGIP